jgi:hypothetical protein
MKYIREITKRFKDDLKNGELKQLLEAVKKDKDLQLEIRRDNKKNVEYLNIYYSGGNLLRVTQTAKGYNFWIDPKYFSKEDKEKREKIKTEGSWIENIPKLKEVMGKYFANRKSKNEREREVQQIMCKYNRDANSRYFIVDVEYQIGNKSRVDMLAISKGGSGVKIALVELKQGNNVDQKSGLYKHYCDFEWLIKNHADDIIQTVKKIYENKADLGIEGYRKDFVFPKRLDFEILFVCYNYNDKSKQLRRVKEQIINEYKGATFKVDKPPKGKYIIGDLF